MRAALAFMAGACIGAAFVYRLARWLIVADRGIGIGVDVSAAVNMAPLRPMDDEDADHLGPFRRGMDGDA